MPTVLVADKNSGIQRIAMRILKGLGVEVVMVGNGEAAVQKIAEIVPDLVMADIFMPGYNGYEVCQFVKKDERFAHIPVILMYGQYDPFDQKESQRVRCDNVLQKPFNPPEPLIGMVKSLLQKSQAARQQAASAGQHQAMRDAHDQFSASVPHHGDTQQLSQDEVRKMTGGAAAAEPEYDDTAQYQKKEVSFDLSGSDQPIGFDEVTEAPAESAGAPAFGGASAVPAEAPPSETPPFEEPPNFGGIEPEMKQPTPDMPPIKVEFSSSPEPLELITNEPSISEQLVVTPDPELSTSPLDFVSSSAPPTAAEEIPSEEETPSELVASLDLPAPARFEVPLMESAAQAAASAGGEPAMGSAPVFPEIPSIAPPIIEESLAPPEEPSASPSGAPATELHGLVWSPGAGAVQTAPEPEPTAASAATEDSATLAGVDLDDLVRKVVGQISPEITERITREVVRRLAETGLGKK